MYASNSTRSAGKVEKSRSSRLPTKSTVPKTDAPSPRVRERRSPKVRAGRRRSACPSTKAAPGPSSTPASVTSVSSHVQDTEPRKASNTASTAISTPRLSAAATLKKLGSSGDGGEAVYWIRSR